jgi:plasmid stabilization system protein ParE
MAHRIVWSTRAAQDLDSIADYIAADSHAYAGIVLKSIVNQTRILACDQSGGRGWRREFASNFRSAASLTEDQTAQLVA